MTLPGPWACYLLVNFRPSVTQYTRTPPIATPALREPSTRRCEAYGFESTLSPSSGNSVLAITPAHFLGSAELIFAVESVDLGVVLCIS